jgi:hypothetical protein
MASFPDAELQKTSSLALNAIVLGAQQMTKTGVMQFEGILPILTLVNSDDEECVHTGIYALGSLSENDEVKSKIVKLGGISAVVNQSGMGTIEVKRAAGYFLALLCENPEFHGEMAKQGGLEAIISLASLEDMECQEYASFSLAHISSNRDFQVRLVELGALTPIVAMMSTNSEPSHYASLALLKLADNFENHVAIASAGGIQSLLRLGRSRATDEEISYKSSLSVGSLAANAVRMLPGSGNSGNGVGFAASAMQAKVSGAAGRGREKTTQYLDNKAG